MSPSFSQASYSFDINQIIISDYHTLRGWHQNQAPPLTMKDVLNHWTKQPNSFSFNDDSQCIPMPFFSAFSFYSSLPHSSVGRLSVCDEGAEERPREAPAADRTHAHRAQGP